MTYKTMAQRMDELLELERAESGVPDAADIAGSVGVNADDVILTVPAGRAWRGTVTLSGGCTAAVGAAATVNTCRVDVAGAGATPAPGVLVELPLALSATIATSPQGAQANGTVSVDAVLVADPGAALTLVLAKSAGMNVMRGSARGELL